MEARKKGLSLKIKSVIIILVMSVILCGVAIFTSAYTFSDTNEKSFKDHANDIAYTAAVNADGDTIKKLTDMVLTQFRTFSDDEIVTSDDWGSPEFEAFTAKFAWITETPEYRAVLDYLSNIVKRADIYTLSAIYVIVYDTSLSEPYALYVADASTEEACFPGVIDSFGEDDDMEAVRDPRKGITPYSAHYEAYGWLVVAGAPVFDSSGNYAAMLAVDLSMDDIKANENKFILNLTILLVAVTFVLGAVYLLIIVKSIVEPINKLSSVASDYIRDSEKKASFDSVDIRRNDEIGDLTHAMQHMEHNINLYIDDISRMTEERARLGAELGIATRIQANMLPTHFPKRDDFSIYAVMSPAKEVGGDFYDFFMIDDDHLGLVMADVSGKGIPAALFMVITKTLIKNRALMGGTPAEVLADVNDQLCENNAAGLFVTVWFGILDIPGSRLTAANAGHEYPAVMRDGGKYELIVHEHCPPLASVEGLTFEDGSITLSHGDRLFLYTDGVTEAKNPKGERYGTDRMVDTLNSFGAADPRDLLLKMKADLDEFNGDNDPFDDITMLGLYYN